MQNPSAALEMVGKAAAIIVGLSAAALGEPSESQGIFSKGVTRAECKLEMFRYKLNSKGN